MHLSRTLLGASLVTIAATASAMPDTQMTLAPSGTPVTRYCLRVAALTGSNVETVQCWTRAEWADQGVDVDQAWLKDGIRAVG